jgi:hypothetical protein
VKYFQENMRMGEKSVLPLSHPILNAFVLHLNYAECIKEGTYNGHMNERFSFIDRYKKSTIFLYGQYKKFKIYIEPQHEMLDDGQDTK